MVLGSIPEHGKRLFSRAALLDKYLFKNAIKTVLCHTRKFFVLYTVLEHILKIIYDHRFLIKIKFIKKDNFYKLLFENVYFTEDHTTKNAVFLAIITT